MMLCVACRVPNYALSRSFLVTSCRPCQSRRSFAHSASHRRAIPFSLSPYDRPQDDREGRVLRMLMFGKPGAGKGTLTLRLAQKYDILTLSTGDILRQQILEQTEVGKEAEAIIARGGLLPDDTILKVVSSKLDALQNKVMSISYSRFVQKSLCICSIGFWMVSLALLARLSS